MSTPSSPTGPPPGVRSSLPPEDEVLLDSGVNSLIDEVTEGQILADPPPPRAPIVGESDPGEHPAARAGDVLAQRYVIKRLLAQGGMGRVYLATQQPLGREVAVKCLIPQPNDKEFRKRFFLEASTCARLTHRHIVTVHDYGEAENGELFMAMEYLRGEPLSRVLAREGRLSSERTGRIALQISRALRAAHRIGVVHRDLKPGNVMLLRDEDQDVPDFIKVLDFGLVKAFSMGEGPAPEPDVGDLTRKGTWLGSPRYMAPEQINCKNVDPRTDIYSLGAIMFHMLAGRPPFTGASSVEIFGQHLRDVVPAIREVAEPIDLVPELEMVARRCLEKDPDRRYQSMDELIGDLKATLRWLAGASAHGESMMGDVHDPAEPSVPSSRSQVPASRSIKPGPHTLEMLATEALLDTPPDGGVGSDSGASPAVPIPPPAPRADAGPVSSPSPPARSSAPRRPEVAMATSARLSVPARRSPPILPIALGGLLGLVLLYLFFGRGEEPREVGGPVATVAPRGASPGEVLVSLVSTPPGAEVSLDGAAIGRTPLDHAVRGRAPGAKLEFTLRLAGHAPRVVQAEVGDAPMSLTVALEPLPSASASPSDVAGSRVSASDAPGSGASPSASRRSQPSPVARRSSPSARPVRVEPKATPSPTAGAVSSPAARGESGVGIAAEGRRIQVDDGDDVPVVGGVPTVE